MTDSTVRGDEFDSWMGGASAPKAEPPPPPNRRASDESVEVKARRKPLAEKFKSGRKAWVVGGSALVVAGVGVAGFLATPEPAQPLSPRLAAIVSPGANTAAAPVPAAASPVSGDGEGGTMGGSAVSDQGAAPSAPKPAPEPKADEGVAANAPQDAATDPKPNASPQSAAEDAPAADAKLRRQALRIEALENDLYRAKRSLKKSKGAVATLKRRSPPAYTVVAVLDDGAVVRDEKGRERVVAVGDEVGQ